MVNLHDTNALNPISRGMKHLTLLIRSCLVPTAVLSTVANRKFPALLIEPGFWFLSACSPVSVVSRVFWLCYLHSVIIHSESDGACEVNDRHYRADCHPSNYYFGSEIGFIGICNKNIEIAIWYIL